MDMAGLNMTKTYDKAYKMLVKAMHIHDFELVIYRGNSIYADKRIVASIDDLEKTCGTHSSWAVRRADNHEWLRVDETKLDGSAFAKAKAIVDTILRTLEDTGICLLSGHDGHMIGQGYASSVEELVVKYDLENGI